MGNVGHGDFCLFPVECPFLRIDDDRLGKVFRQDVFLISVVVLDQLFKTVQQLVSLPECRPSEMIAVV